MRATTGHGAGAPSGKRNAGLFTSLFAAVLPLDAAIQTCLSIDPRLDTASLQGGVLEFCSFPLPLRHIFTADIQTAFGQYVLFSRVPRKDLRVENGDVGKDVSRRL